MVAGGGILIEDVMSDAQPMGGLSVENSGRHSSVGGFVRCLL